MAHRCHATPDRTLARGGTWHDETKGKSSTDNIYFEYTFQGLHHSNNSDPI